MNTDPYKEPIEKITDAWFLRDGSLYMTVLCSDGVRRTVTKQMPKKDKKKW